MRYAAPGTVRPDERPPVATDIAPSPGAAARISAQTRTRIWPRLWPTPLLTGVDPTHPYVRAYWSAIVGTSAVADLMRMIVAANRSTSLAHPLFVHVLTREGLVHHFRDHMWVHSTVAPLGTKQVARLTPRLKRFHSRDLAKALEESR